ncbi:MAG: FAD-dependent oxidoreductase [Ferruginibacter sp.]
MERDGANKSLWQLNEQYAAINTIDVNELYDVVIVGGGITGITLGLLLQSAGKNCLLVEAHTLGFGTTGGTTAHLNTFFDTPYSQVIKDFGRDNALLLARGAGIALDLIKKNIADWNIDCDFSELNGYLFAVNESQDEELTDIVKSCRDMQVDADFSNNSVFPFPYSKLAIFKNQAQFNPIKYIFSLAKVFEERGGKILEHHRVMDIERQQSSLMIKTDRVAIQAKKAIYATHIPPGAKLLDFKCAPYRSYAIAVKLASGEYPMALGYDMDDPYHYYRTQYVDGSNYLIAGGEDHKTGHESHTDACFGRLENHVKNYFDVKEIAFRWSSQYYEPADGLPYIGKLSAADDDIYVATGFGGNGMIYGTLSAVILSNMVVHGQSIYEDLFNPGRVKPVAGFSNIVKEGADVVKHFLGDKFSANKIKTFSEIISGEGSVVKHDGQTLAVYKDQANELHIVDPVCTHLKCNVSWNPAEKSWDCPCHGARYSIEGEVLNGPACISLKKMQVREEEENNGSLKNNTAVRK